MIRSVVAVGLIFVAGCVSKPVTLPEARVPAGTGEIGASGSAVQLRMNLQRPAHYIIDAKDPNATPREVPFYEKVKHDNRYCRVRISAAYVDPSVLGSIRDGVDELKNDDITLFASNKGSALKEIYQTGGYKRVSAFYTTNDLLTQKTVFTQAAMATIYARPFDGRLIRFPKYKAQYHGFKMTFLGQPRSLSPNYWDAGEMVEEKVEVFCFHVEKKYYPNVLNAMSSLLTHVPNSLYETNEIWEEAFSHAHDSEYTQPRIYYNDGRG